MKWLVAFSIWCFFDNFNVVWIVCHSVVLMMVALSEFCVWSVDDNIPLCKIYECRDEWVLVSSDVIIHLHYECWFCCYRYWMGGFNVITLISSPTSHFILLQRLTPIIHPDITLPQRNIMKIIHPLTSILNTWSNFVFAKLQTSSTLHKFTRMRIIPSYFSICFHSFVHPHLAPCTHSDFTHLSF